MNATERLLAQLRQAPDLTLDRSGSRVVVRHKGRTLATVDPERARFEMVVPRQFVSILRAKVPEARRTRRGLAVHLDGGPAADAAATSLLRMRIDEEQFGWQFGQGGP